MYVCNNNVNINSRAWICPNTFKSTVINMSGDNTCSNKIKIDCGCIGEKDIARHVNSRMRSASDSTHLLLLVPKHKRSPSVGLLAFFLSYVSPLGSLVKPYSFIVHVRAMLHGLCCMSILQVRSALTIDHIAL